MNELRTDRVSATKKKKSLLTVELYDPIHSRHKKTEERKTAPEETLPRLKWFKRPYESFTDTLELSSHFVKVTTIVSHLVKV
jgi:hypothetical protein